MLGLVFTCIVVSTFNSPPEGYVFVVNRDIPEGLARAEA